MQVEMRDSFVLAPRGDDNAHDDGVWCIPKNLFQTGAHPLAIRRRIRPGASLPVRESTRGIIEDAGAARVKREYIVVNTGDVPTGVSLYLYTEEFSP